VIVIAMVDGEFVQVLAVELASATSTDPRIKLQCLFAIVALALFPIAAGGGNDLLRRAAATIWSRPLLLEVEEGGLDLMNSTPMDAR